MDITRLVEKRIVFHNFVGRHVAIQGISKNELFIWLAWSIIQIASLDRGSSSY